MSPRRCRAAAAGLEAFVGADVELRLGGGAVVRGSLVEIGEEFLTVECARTRRRTLVRRTAVTVAVDESPGRCLSAGKVHRDPDAEEA